jgi:hypothetical protein
VASIAAPLEPCRFPVDRTPTGVGRDQDAAVVELDQPAVTGDLDRRAGQPGAGLVVGVSKVPGPLAPRNRGRVPKVSSSYRSHPVRHEPGQHIHRYTPLISEEPVCLRTNSYLAVSS